MPLAEALLDLIPHAGRMRLVTEVLGWDADRLTCRADSHRAPDHPLRDDAGRLHAIHAVEYAGQACALHAAALAYAAGEEPQAGLLAGVSAVELQAERLDTLPAPLDIQVARLFGDGQSAIYTFDIRCAERPVAHGRLTLVAGRELAT